jgi:hypothetical protein
MILVHTIHFWNAQSPKIEILNNSKVFRNKYMKQDSQNWLRSPMPKGEL